MDSDDSSNPNDPGMNMDSASASSETPRANMDPITSYDDHSGIHTGQSSSSQVSTMHPNIHLLCVNCGINISRMRRHPLVIAEVRHLIQRWIEPQQVQVTSDNLVCHSCWMSAWSEIRQPAPMGQQSEPIVGHAHVCVSCGHSLLRSRSHTLRSDTPREERIMNEVTRQVAPRELPTSASVCHTCWRRIDRAVARSVQQDTPAQPSSTPSESVTTASTTNEDVVATANCLMLPNYIRAPGTQSRCFYPNCVSSERITVPNDLRVRLFCDYNFYVPAECRICLNHLRSNAWDSLLDSLENPIRTFSAEQVEEFTSLLKNSMFHHLDFENINEMPDHIVHYYLGFSKEQFLDILSNVPRLSNKHRGSFALAAYLIKLRTGDSDERLAALLQVPRSTLERHMNEARELLTQDFVPRNLGINHITRAEIAARNLIIPGGLYQGEDRSPIIIADGTYIYIEKSSNYLYQKKTYSLHKYRNLVKPFLLVCTDGYIIDILGPYPATTSDATIMVNEFHENSSYRQYFQPGDVFILDRGFRDSLPLLTTCGYRVHVPLSPADGESQLNTVDANKSRAVTLCRWVVEVVNGIFKSSFKIFRQNFFNRASSHLMKDFAVAAGLINKYHTKIRDREDATQILEIVRQNMNVNNDLSDYVREHNLNRARAHFTNINVNIENIREFPILTYSDLVLIACGTYQIKQARSYYGEHIRFNGSYHIEVCSDRRRSIFEASAFSSNCYLLRTKISSRHVSRKIYFVYILINTNNTGRAAIKKYCCNCIVGRRTVGCCAHVMSVIWYLGWARHQSNIDAPAQFLDEVLIVYDNEE